jgi:hypothetical protein
MSTKVKESLFELVHSMTKSEKRYFKLMAARHTIGEENNYVVLFDFIDKQERYDEAAIFLAFKDQALLNKFSITKKRLYDHILMSLDAFHAASSSEAQIYRLLHSARILYTKSLYEQARRVLNSAEKQIRKLDDPILLQKLSELRKKLIENEGYTESTGERIREISELDKASTDKILMVNHLWKLKSELMQRLRQKGICRSEEELRFFKQAVENLPDPIDIKGFEAVYLYNQIRSICSFAERSLEDARAWIGENIDLYRKDRDRIGSDASVYASLLSNAVYLDESLGNRSRANQLLMELRLMLRDLGAQFSEDQQVKLFGSIQSVELGVHLKRGDFHHALSLIPAVEVGMKRFGEKLSATRRAFIAFKIASVYLGSNLNNDALKWINKTVNDPELDPSEDILSFTYLLELLVYLEMGKMDLVQYAVKNIQRFLKSRNKLFGLERAFLTTVSKISRSKSLLDTRMLWDQFISQLSDSQSSTWDQAALDYFDFRSWAESKVTGKTFAEIIRERNNQGLKKAS